MMKVDGSHNILQLTVFYEAEVFCIRDFALLF